MTESSIASGSFLARLAERHGGRALLPIAGFAILILLLLAPQTRDVTITALRDAYLQVTVFVAATLSVVYLYESRFDVDFGQILGRTAGWQPFLAALLGATPGCGGAILVVTQYTRGYASFGSLVAVLSATMGDAAFLLIARQPLTALFVIGTSIVTGSLIGALVDRIHGRGFMSQAKSPATVPSQPATGRRWTSIIFSAASILWMLWLVPGIILGAALAFQVDIDQARWTVFGVSAGTLIGVGGALLAVLLWAIARQGNTHSSLQPGGPAGADTSTRVIQDTNFVTAWVVMAFVAYELSVHLFDFDLTALFQGWAPLMPLMGMLVGLIPGCGPQILVTSLYLAGAIPLSAQLTNAIANDGDALFPAIALAPRAALLATLYSAIPALIIGYGYMLLAE